MRKGKRFTEGLRLLSMKILSFCNYVMSSEVWEVQCRVMQRAHSSLVLTLTVIYITVFIYSLLLLVDFVRMEVVGSLG
jgi:hypothetical protein